MGGATLQLRLLNYVFRPVFKPKPCGVRGITGPFDVFLFPMWLPNGLGSEVQGLQGGRLSF